MNKIKSLLIVICTIFIAGCAGDSSQFEAVERICVPNVGVVKATDKAEVVLAKMNFVIDKSDPSMGVIRTKPLSGAQFFEFWRSDNIGAFNKAEANLHSIRRTVELNIGSKSQQLCIVCKVNVSRLSLPERKVTSSSHAYRMFTDSSSSEQRLELDPEQEEKIAWVEIGRDKRLETEILRRIQKKIVTQ